MIGVIISAKLASLAEIDTVLGLEDVYDLVEIITIDAFNRANSQREV